jgi:uncharacterized SAM-binding protein YcdF (DUF218 family)
VLEEESRTTWENIANVIPTVEDLDRIRVASLPAHALKARVYARRQRPGLAPELGHAAGHTIGEWAPLKPLLAAHGLRTVRSAREDLP